VSRLELARTRTRSRVRLECRQESQESEDVQIPRGMGSMSDHTSQVQGKMRKEFCFREQKKRKKGYFPD
jgi:hypothetical protein